MFQISQGLNKHNKFEMENRGMTVFMVLALVALAQISSAESGQSNTNNAPVETLKSTINLQVNMIHF